MGNENFPSKFQLLHPEVFQAQLMSKFLNGKFLEKGDVVSPFLRAQVISFDPSGGNLENPQGNGSMRSQNPSDQSYYDIKARVGPSNPPRALRARIVTNHLDTFTTDEDLRVFWPMFPSFGSDPVPLEFVYVFFESGDRYHGLWVSRVPGPLGENLNFSPGDQPYKDAAASGGGQQSLAASFGDAPAPADDYATQQAIVGVGDTKTDKFGD